MSDSHVWHWFWALSSWEFFLAERTCYQVMPVFRVPRDPPVELSYSTVILDNLNYRTSSFKGFVTKDTNYFTWFLQSSTEPIIDNCLMSGGRVLNGITRTRQASEAHLRLHIDTLQARVRELEGAAAIGDGYMQEEIARFLARERDRWEREREVHAIATQRKREG